MSKRPAHGEPGHVCAKNARFSLMLRGEDMASTLLLIERTLDEVRLQLEVAEALGEAMGISPGLVDHLTHVLNDAKAYRRRIRRAFKAGIEETEGERRARLMAEEVAD